MVSAYYAVARGKTVGIFPTWDQCKQQVNGFPNARYKKFSSQREAEQFIEENRGGAASSASASTSNSLAGYGYISGPHMTQHNGRKRALVPNVSTANYSDAPKRNRGEDWDDAPVVYTDGACSNNGKAGARAGYGVYWGRGSRNNCCGPVHGEQTNNRGELIAVSMAMKQAIELGKPRIQIMTDSKLCINSLDSWLPKWKRNGWKTANGAAVKNQDLLEEIDSRRKRVQVRFEYVAAHCGIDGNEEADELARRGARA